MGISQYTVIIVAIAIFLIPASQAEGLLVPIEIEDETYFIFYKEIQEDKAEKFRDYYLQEYLRLQNPYHNEIDDLKITSDKEIFLNSIHREDENFQTFKDEQISLAQKKYLELTGGKSVTNSFDDKSASKSFTVLKSLDIEIDYEKPVYRDDEKFKSFIIQQEILAENTVRDLIQEGIWEEDPFVIAELFEDEYSSTFDPSRDAESIEAAFDLIEDEIVTAEELIENEVISSKDLIKDNVISADYLELFWKSYEPEENTKVETIQKTVVMPEKDDFDWKEYEWKNKNRENSEFQNLITEQILLAENTRDEELSSLPHFNPYEEEVDTIISQEDFVEVIQIIKREDEQFEIYKIEQIDKAELFFGDFYHLKNLNENEDEKVNDLKIEKEFELGTIYDRNDPLFKLLKMSEETKAEKKLLEMFGGKNIQN